MSCVPGRLVNLCSMQICQFAKVSHAACNRFRLRLHLPYVGCPLIRDRDNTVLCMRPGHNIECAIINNEWRQLNEWHKHADCFQLLVVLLCFTQICHKLNCNNWKKINETTRNKTTKKKRANDC